MPNFRTSSLFHYTSYEALKSILQNGIFPNYCMEDLSYIVKENPRKYIFGIPMVSFCDIPIMRAKAFTGLYGRHAIGLSKEWALKNKINPVFYINDDNIIRALLFYVSYEALLRDQLKKIGSDGRTLTVNLMDPKSVSNLVPLINHGKSHQANVLLLGFAKKYEGKDRDDSIHCNYEDNEWRYIINEALGDSGVKWKRGEKEYKLWRGDVNQPKPSSPELAKYTLKFNAKDVTYIIVEKESQIPNMVKFIDKLISLGGSGEAINEEEKRLLYSKIISMEEIRKDF